MGIQQQGARFRVKLRGPGGHKCTLELRGPAGVELLERAGSLLDWAEKLGYRPTGKAKERETDGPGTGTAKA